MKLLHVITGINRGGAENHLVELVRHQRAVGMDVSVAYLRGQGYWASELKSLGAQVHDLALKFYGDLAPVLQLRRLIKKTQCDLLHAHLPPAELYSRLALLGTSRRSVPMLITKHNEERFYNGPGQRFLGRWTARRADRVIAISKAVKQYMSGRGLGVDEGKFETILYGIDAAGFVEPRAAQVAALRKEWGVPVDAITIGFVGRVVPQKDIGTLIRGFALFAQTMPDARLVIVGAGPCEDELRNCASALGIAERLIWAGFREDIQTVMRAFDIFALASIYEGFGLVLLEAMAASVAVAATRVGAIPEVVAEGETGLLIEPRKPEALATIFHQLSDRNVRTRMGNAGRQRVLQEFTRERMWEETDALYARCTRGATAEASTPLRDVPVKALSPSAELQGSN